jgi:hypothetical protein
MNDKPKDQDIGVAEEVDPGELCFAKTTSGWKTDVVHGFVGGFATNFRLEMADR